MSNTLYANLEPISFFFHSTECGQEYIHPIGILSQRHRYFLNFVGHSTEDWPSTQPLCWSRWANAATSKWSPYRERGSARLLQGLEPTVG